MTAFVALLRAVNVAGTGKLPMTELKAIGEACGFENVRTFIASGNLLRVPVFVRSAAEMAEVVVGNPFGDDKPSRVMAHFIAEAPTKAMLDEARDVQGERMAIGPRVIYISYGEGIGKTRLKLPAIKNGTARNLNSVARIAELLK